MSHDDDETMCSATEEGRSSLTMESNADNGSAAPPTRRRAGFAAAAGVLLLGGAMVLVSSVVSTPGDDTNSTPDNQLFGGAAARPFQTSKSLSSFGSVSIKFFFSTSPNGTSTAAQALSQCLVTPNGWTVSAVEEELPQYPVLNAIDPSWIGHSDVTFGYSNPEAPNRTFDVEPNHTVLTDEEGVIFNVETTPGAFPQDLSKPHLSAQEIEAAVEAEAGRFYQPRGTPKPPNVTLEVMSEIEEGNLVFAGGQGFVASAMMAFAYHLPLALAPDHLWAVITSGFAYHVNQYPEELRHHFVKHQGQVELRVREDSIRMGESPPREWEELVFPRFTAQIQENLNNTKVHDLLVHTNFSTSTVASQSAAQITLMSSMKAFFRYTLVTLCGIPNIKLEGTRDDWQHLRSQTAQLAQWMMPNHPQGDLWIQDVVLPILDEFLEAYDGNVNYCFWQSMVKFRLNQDGCHSFDFLSGWLPTLFPYLDVGSSILENRFLRHWSESSLGDVRGPDPSQLPIQMSSAPVRWLYFRMERPLHFHAGFRGVSQDETDGMLRPALGWYVTHDP